MRTTWLVLSVCVLVGCAGTAPIAGQTPPMRIYTFDKYEIHAPQGADIRSAREEVDYAVSQFTRVFGTPPYIAVTLFASSADMIKYDLEPLHKRKVPHLGWFLGGKEPPAVEGSRALSHEACHTMFNNRWRRRVGWVPPAVAPKASEVKYGAETIPDWLDEAAAVLCEFPALKANREAHLAKHAPVPLATFFTMEHPALATMRRMLSEAPSDAGVSVGRDASEKPTMDPLLFYAQAGSVAEFIGERGGPKALALLTDHISDGLTTEQALAKIPGLPRTVAEFETEWAQWRRSR